MQNNVPNILSKHTYINVLFLSVFSLIIGGAIYIVCRPTDPIFFNWLDTLGLDYLYKGIRHINLSTSHVPLWFVYSLPNGLWAFSYALIIASIWSGSNSPLRYFWMSSIPIFILGFEFIQLIPAIPGTFSFQDVFFGLSGLIFGIILGLKLTKSNKYEKKGI